MAPSLMALGPDRSASALRSSPVSGWSIRVPVDEQRCWGVARSPKRGARQACCGWACCMYMSKAGRWCLPSAPAQPLRPPRSPTAGAAASSSSAARAPPAYCDYNTWNLLNNTGGRGGEKANGERMSATRWVFGESGVGALAVPRRGHRAATTGATTTGDEVAFEAFSMSTRVFSHCLAVYAWIAARRRTHLGQHVNAARPRRGARRTRVAHARGKDVVREERVVGVWVVQVGRVGRRVGATRVGRERVHGGECWWEREGRGSRG